jgi:hypothetical protein
MKAKQTSESFLDNPFSAELHPVGIGIFRGDRHRLFTVISSGPACRMSYNPQSRQGNRPD